MLCLGLGLRLGRHCEVGEFIFTCLCKKKQDAETDSFVTHMTLISIVIYMKQADTCSQTTLVKNYYTLVYLWSYHYTIS